MKQNKKHYTQAFYKSQMDESLSSAQMIVPKIIELFRPTSVVDVGCGIGTWSSVFFKEGIQDVIGLDGNYVDHKQLLIKEKSFIETDLRKKVEIDKKFDLAISLEVIEHLNDYEGKKLVETLVKLAPVVVFSAAIPGQGGTNHINERWQSYWAREFAKYGFDAHDIIRPLFWNSKQVYVCYKQNTIVYISREFKNLHPEHVFENLQNNVDLLDTVHPDLWIALINYSKIDLGRIFGYYKDQTKSRIKKVLGR